MNEAFFNYQVMMNDIRKNIKSSSQIQREAIKATSFINSPEYQKLRNINFFIGNSEKISEALDKSLNISRISQINRKTLEAFRHSFGHTEMVLDNISKLKNLKIPSIDVMTHIINENDLVKMTDIEILSETYDSEGSFEENSDYIEDNFLKEKVEYLTKKLFEPLWDYIVIANNNTIGITTKHTYELALKNSDWFYFFIMLNTIQLIIFIACFEYKNEIEGKIK